MSTQAAHSLPIRTRVIRAVILIAFFGVAFVAAAFLQLITMDSWGHWKSFAHIAVLFAVLGALYGTVATLDEASEFSVSNLPRVRTAICAVLGASAVFVVWSWYPENFSLAWALGGATGGAVLGWYGWKWAKHVDF